MRRQPGISCISKAAPGVSRLQRALIWLAGASVAICFIEPIPYEVVTARHLGVFSRRPRLRLLFMAAARAAGADHLGYT